MNRLIVTLFVTFLFANILPMILQGETGIDAVDDTVVYAGIQKDMIVPVLLATAAVYWITDYILKNMGNSIQ
jgi:hypothetical protein